MTDKKLSQLSTGSLIDARDLFYSAPNTGGSQVKQTARAVRAFARPEAVFVDDPTYGVVTGTVSGAQALLNTTGINTAIADATAAGVDVQFGPYRYQIDGTIVVIARVADNRAPLINGLKYSTRIEQVNAAGGIDTLRFGPAVGGGGQGTEGGGVTNMWFVSMVDNSAISPLSGHLGALLAITTAEFATFGNLYFGEINLNVNSHSHFPYNIIGQDPAGTTFSCYFFNIQGKGYGNIGWNAVGSDSGSVHYNVQIRNGGLGESPLKTSTGQAIWIANAQGIWDQINLEWSHFDGFNVMAMVITSSAGIKFGHLHLEGLQFSNSGGNTVGGIIGLFGFGDCSFDSIHLITLNLSTPANLPSFGVFTGGFNANAPMTTVVGQLLIIQTLTLGTGVGFYLVNTIGGASTVSNWVLDFNGPVPLIGDGSFASKLTNWSNATWKTNGQGPANGLGVPPTNFRGRSILSVTSSAYGYSSTVFTASMLDDNDTYIWTAGANGTVVLPLTVMDAGQPVTLPPYPGTERTIINPTGGGNTVAVHDSAATNLLAATNLTAGQFVRLRFDGTNWKQINAGTLL